MSKKVKGIIEKEFSHQFKGIDECMVVSIRGISGIDNNLMRGVLTKKNIHLTVVKNSLARRAFESLGHRAIGELFEGPSAVVYGGDSIVDVAKEMIELGKKYQKLEIKGAFMAGAIVKGEAAKALAKLPTRPELQATLAATALSPGRKLASAVLAPATRIAGCLEALVKKMEAA